MKKIMFSLWAAVSCIPARHLAAAAAGLFCGAGVVLAQSYDLASEAAGDPSLFEEFLTSPPATLLMVFIGAFGVFQMFFNAGKGERSDKQQLWAFICFALLAAMCWYRFQHWLSATRR